MDLSELLSTKKTIKYADWITSGDYNFILVTKDTIKACIDHCLKAPKGYVSADLECTGLDNRVKNGETVDKIVGLCLSPDGVTGYYIPLRHTKGSEHNVPWSVFDKQFRRLIRAVESGKIKLIWHNAKFDLEFLEFNGGEPYGSECWSKPSPWEDTMFLGYLRWSTAKRRGLKALSETPVDADHTSAVGGPGLGMKMIELYELFPEGHPKDNLNFALVDPSDEGPRIYGCSDAICTYKLYELLAPVVLEEPEKSQETIYRIEKLCSASVRWMERNRLKTDRKKVMELVSLGQHEWLESIFEVYQAAQDLLGRDIMPGYYKVLKDHWVADDPHNLLKDQLKFAKARGERYYPDPVTPVESGGRVWPPIYDINAPKQLGQMFDEMNVPGLVRTEKSGQVKTSRDVLQKVIDEASAQFPFMGKVGRFRQVSKALSNYLFPLLEQSDQTDDTIRINFRQDGTATGRFATPSKSNEIDADHSFVDGHPRMNFQSIPSTYDPKRPECMTRIRECIIAREDYFLVALDFAGQELRVAANLSNEQLWIDEFFRCSSCELTFERGDGIGIAPSPPPRCPNCGSDKIGDLHTLTALSIYGDDAINKPDWKALRGKGKSLNFALCYGGGGNAAQQACDVDIQEGWRIRNAFEAKYTSLGQYWRMMHNFAMSNAYVLTTFGRVFPLPDVKAKEKWMVAKAMRNATNTPIQGTCADMMKIGMGLVFKEFQKRGWLVLGKIIATMHDELVFEIHKSILFEAIEVARDIMSKNIFIECLNWQVPFTLDCEIGRDWTCPWDLNEMLYGEVRFEGDKKLKPPKKPKNLTEKAQKEYETKLAYWETLPNFPACLRELNPPQLEVVSVEEALDDEIEEEGVTGEVIEDGVYIFDLSAELDAAHCMKMARVIEKAQDSEGDTLKLRLKGKVLEGWHPAEKPVRVNAEKFGILARRYNLQETTNDS